MLIGESLDVFQWHLAFEPQQTNDGLRGTDVATMIETLKKGPWVELSAQDAWPYAPTKIMNK